MQFYVCYEVIALSTNLGYLETMADEAAIVPCGSRFDACVYLKLRRDGLSRYYGKEPDVCSIDEFDRLEFVWVAPTSGSRHHLRAIRADLFKPSVN